MSVERHSGIKSGAVTDSGEPIAERQQLEDKIKAVEEISRIILENAARREIVDYLIEKKAKAEQCQDVIS
jgi:hypothetical protein